ncbi:MAG: voltage-gated potassium channel, partial [Baekduia sp.]|jgi:voltage-gated potassium channel|nr:voltage-gated potassium channel [Baekduia sp.]
VSQNAVDPRRRKPHRRARFERRAERAIANRHVFRYLAGATFLLALVSGVTVWLIDRRDFHTLGDGLWWSLVTLATVGYGDIVPHTAWGRIVGAVVIIVGVTFLSLLTATITSYFVSSDQEARAAEVEALRGEATEDTDVVLQQILDRVTAIEQALRDRSGRDTGA